jgi:hypothetical protein
VADGRVFYALSLASNNGRVAYSPRHCIHCSFFSSSRKMKTKEKSGKLLVGLEEKA